MQNDWYTMGKNFEFTEFHIFPYNEHTLKDSTKQTSMSYAVEIKRMFLIIIINDSYLFLKEGI